MSDRTSETSWLCDEGDRERLVDMEARLKPVRLAAMGLLAVALIACGPWVGWWTLIPLVVAAAGFAVMDRDLGSSPRPEYRMAAAWVLSQLAIAVSAAVTGGPKSVVLAWLAIPVVTLAARFSGRGVAVGVTLTALLMLGTAIGVDPAYIWHHPQSVIFPLALLGAVATLSIALMRSDLQHRSAAIIDPLTSMLNRGALATRVAELAQQALVVNQPIGLVVGDLDRFKAINDTHGHAAGDAVLRDVAYRMRKQLRAFDLAYRLGGEEFLVVLPGANADQAAAVAEDLREAVASAPVAGLAVTMSFGVSAAAAGAFDYDTVFEQADLALYEAKHAGRDCVRVRGTGEEPAGLLPAYAS
jgi:diguanylate cyclase (GGDEF)-like protein